MKELRILTTTYVDAKGNVKHLKAVARYTEKSASAYANKMYRKYGDATRVEEYLTVQQRTVHWGA